MSYLIAVMAASFVPNAYASEPAQCQTQTAEKIVFEMCLLPGAAFQHDLYTLKADKVLLAALVDDYAESVQLEHKVPDGPSIEFALSRQGGSPVSIVGGCVPESKDGAEVARVCNFRWGKIQIIKDVRFEFK